MLGYMIPVCLALLGLAVLLTVARLIRGPGAADRILALDTLSIEAIALIVLFGMWKGSGLYFEAALLIAVMGFVSTVALSKFLLRGDIIE
ncbi:K+/H+ antiporter subunit F [Pseudomonas sp. ZM23]|uniref:K+/H+ antiporter subunit F n=1 Tax=Pseudomonas triclosanedens TaxID=2961893 RepID=A0ABY7A3Q0_9PSED|nr:K+/H+ antiporter subunit F [Pseudomonas triclosanedens]MCP8464366.1 K+/H+ antiporter subunit F [Pseudomonas triclosanedens]MCP8471500.1 K+/H+ antiporter subunit F [Pseudomonas triclosanedens]MCP8477691.1 K+/H+ antiporter subunit F [Pseudomonas triclosanedens]WAI51146.1 K+/H+ antiporter subunit F [Pseudomonas triclosanedens]